MQYIKQDVNNVLLVLVILTCTALVTLTVVFATQFEQLSSEVYSSKEQFSTLSKDLESKAVKLSELERTTEAQKQREEALKKLLESK